MQTRQPIRVIVLVSPHSPHAKKASYSPDGVIQDAFKTLKLTLRDVPHKYLLNQIWDIVNIFVVNLYHDKYDYATAHNKEDLPVIFVNYSRRKVYVSVANGTGRDEANQDVARMLDRNGWDGKLSFFEDHRAGRVPRYPNPRCMVRSKRASDPMAETVAQSGAPTVRSESSGDAA